MRGSSVHAYRQGDGLKLRIVGFLGGDSRLFSVDLKGVQKLTLDLEAVTDISSMGVKSWIQWLSQLPLDCRLVLKNCPVSIMNQVAVFSGFAPESLECESLLIPYYCDTCSKDKLVPFLGGVHFDKHENGEPILNYPDNTQCDQSDCKMTVDILERKFLEFIGKLKRIESK